MTAITKKAISNRIKEKRTPGDWALDIFKVLFLAVITIITVYPFWNIFVVSINDATDAVRGGIYFWPRVFSTASYGEILGRSAFHSGHPGPHSDRHASGCHVHRHAGLSPEPQGSGGT